MTKLNLYAVLYAVRAQDVRADVIVLAYNVYNSGNTVIQLFSMMNGEMLTQKDIN